MTGRASAGLLDWIASPSDRRGLYVLDRGTWRFHSYARLADRATRIATALRRAGLHDGNHQVVGIATAPGIDFVAGFYGTLLAGGTVCPLPPRPALGGIETHRRHLLTRLRVARPWLVLTDKRNAAVVAHAASAASVPAPVLTADLSRSGGHPPLPGFPSPGDTPALLQFTSGSTGEPRGITIGASVLRAGVDLIRDWLGLTPTHTTVSWLPVHHDMGLVGCLLTPVTAGGDIRLMPPADFVRDPHRYVRCLSAHGTTVTAMPPFGLDYVSRRLRSADVADVDLSGVSAVVVGAERVESPTLRAFHALLGPRGLGRSTVVPAYGLAEATLAVTGVRPGQLWRALGSTDAAFRRTLVGCGQPLGATEVTVLDEAGDDVSAGVVGEIAVRGPSVAFTATDGVPAGAGRWLRTGDAGLLDRGELFVVGRLGDSLKVRGRTVFAEEIDTAVTDAGVARDRVCSLLGVDEVGPVVVVVVERPAAGWTDAAAVAARRAVHGVRHAVVAVGRGAIMRTTSGKPRRRAMWAAWQAGALVSR